MAVQPAEVPPQLVGMEIGIAGPVGRQQPLGHGDLEAAREIPGDLVLIELVAARRQVEVVGAERAQLGADEEGGIGGVGHSLPCPLGRPALRSLTP